MVRIIFILGLVLLAITGWRWCRLRLRQLPPEQRRGFILHASFWGLVALLLLLTVTGKLHPLGLAIAAAVPVITKGAGLLIRALPFLRFLQSASKQSRGQFQQQSQQQSKEQSQQQSPPAKGGLSRDEALEILGLEDIPSQQQILDAHRRLIQKCHPDRGGNDYLAAKINQAKDLLLQEFKA